MTANIEELRAFFKQAVSISTKVAGGTAGAVAAYAFQEPAAGILAAPFIAVTLESVGNEFIERHLSPRQSVRAGKLIVYAAENIERRLQLGELPRSDRSFFESDGEFQSPAGENLEAALSAAMAAYEERKVKLIANIISKIYL